MKFGVCSGQKNALVAQQAGWDFLEENVQSLLKGLETDWVKPHLQMPVPSANSMVPANIPIVGPNVSHEQLIGYMTNVLTRASQVGIRTVVFGSGGARNVPEGFDRNKAVDQITEFLNLIAPLAQSNGITIVIEPLNRKECNIINSVKEAMTYVKAVNHPNIQCLVDSYHFWLEEEPLENLEAAMPWIRHVHVADKEGRVAPGVSGKSDYRPFFKVLKQGGYDRLIAVEGRFDWENDVKSALSRLKEDWAAA